MGAGLMKDLIQTREIGMEQLSKLAEAGYVYAIFDACDEPLVPPKMQELGEDKALSLFKGGAQESYWAVAPYLAKVDGGMLTWINDHLNGTRWGIFVFTKADLPALHKHLRHFLIVQLHDSRQWFFRFYDPRILGTYLPTCNGAELKNLFGPVRGFAMAAEDKMIFMEMAPAPAGAADVPTASLSYIRPEQYGALDELALSDFRQRLRAHLLEFFPKQCEELRDRGVDELILHGQSKANLYGIGLESGICKLLDLMISFGPDFDSDPKHIWASQILNDQAEGDMSARVSQLVERSIRVLRESELQVGGQS
jgi:Domain of unknown function (DUF4123)